MAGRGGCGAPCDDGGDTLAQAEAERAMGDTLRARLRLCAEDFARECPGGGGGGAEVAGFAYQHRSAAPHVTQQGPQCGLVAGAAAVAMMRGGDDDIGESARRTLEHMMSYAVERRYTNRGEMFSARWLADVLAACAGDSGLVARVQRPAPDAERLCADMMGRGALVLAPYDCDRDHSPAMNGGATAHWALLTGFVVLHTVDGPPDDGCDGDDSGRGGYDAVSRITWLSAGQSVPSAPDDAFTKVHFIAVHGKSRHPAVWPADRLLRSCGQLKSLGASRLGDGHEYAMPPGGVAEGLCDAVVVVAPPWSSSRRRELSDKPI